MLNADTARGQVLFTAEDYDEAAEEAGPVEFMACVDEVELLTAFWDVAKHYEAIVTFNGRGFDVPFIYLRSALLNVSISRKDWLAIVSRPSLTATSRNSLRFITSADGTARRGDSTWTSTARRLASSRQEPGRDRLGREHA